ncbi:glycoside hydrolase superfamily [Dactylonectria macrodidyma]|uniref:non-reducing end alpha-L-arabinofuranosidase n=1 Tax=Dactylonectria macrodidyma TaxID=307937 RepID=A0A9P9DY22_9HYPO|nr:glycoside hydrolase superfamily [Dactylonectria macrodidyma]
MIISSCSILVAAWTLSVAAVDITVKSSGGNATSGYQYGLLHEDINHSGDGGIYAELIRNRAFQGSDLYPISMDAWTPVNGAILSLQNLSKPLSSALPASLNVAAPRSSKSQVGFKNEGYWGIHVKKQKYTGSFWVKGAYHGFFTASLRSGLTGETFGSVRISSKVKPNAWVEHEFELVPRHDAPTINNTFAITFDVKGIKGNKSLNFNLISLFPPTYKGRKNGLRIDLAEAIEGYHPSFFRIPGGANLEGISNTTWWNWKDSILPLRDRPGFPSTWGYEQTLGLGLMEYLLWAEDMNMKLVVAVYAGLDVNGGITPKEKLQPFIDSAIEEIEFISGPANSTWGSKRAELGHPEPFQLEYVEIGNEDWLLPPSGSKAGWESYIEYRFPMFREAINEAYPHISVVGSGSVFDNYTIPENAIGDYHVYPKPNQLVTDFGKFDNIPSKHIIGEVAATTGNDGQPWGPISLDVPWWTSAVGEGIALISYERNADRVISTCYAPILRNLNQGQAWPVWPITMIQHAADPALTTRSTSWHVWELFASYPMTHTLPATAEFDPLFYVTGKNERKGSHIAKLAAYNTTNSISVPVSVTFDGVKRGTAAELTILTSKSGAEGFNNPYTSKNIVHCATSRITSNSKGAFRFKMPELSVAVLETIADE